MNLEPQWWHHPKYWFKSPVDGMEEPDLEKIVAEATRRGEMKAFRSIRDFLDRKDSDTISKSDIYGICQEN